MSRMTPLSRKELIRRLRRLGFDGPYHGGKHDFMLRTSDRMRLVLPREDAKSREIGIELQKRILREIGVSTGQWTAL